MGSGKTTLGKKIANRLKIPFVDSDQEIEEHFGKTISEIFVEFGESRFREIEQEYIAALDLRDDFVLATGGGMPCFGDNMSSLNQLGLTFYLKRSPKELTQRLLQAKSKRPLLEGLAEDDLLTFVENKLALRNEFYAQSNIILDRSEQTVDDIIKFASHLQVANS